MIFCSICFEILELSKNFGLLASNKSLYLFFKGLEWLEAVLEVAKFLLEVRLQLIRVLVNFIKGSDDTYAISRIPVTGTLRLDIKFVILRRGYLPNAFGCHTCSPLRFFEETRGVR